MPTLFDPITVGALQLPNRIFMAPLTRSRAGTERVPNDLMRAYYVQRASAGLILSEATSVTPMGVGYADTPGIWSEEQVAGWKHVVQGVHDAGGKMFLQLWHVGRVSDPMFLNGQTPVSASALRPPGTVSLVRPPKEFVTPRALELAEMPGVVAAYRQGAENAQAAGFDGVEIHGANGYLLDQFLQTGTNHRTDEYGGTVENRARLMLEVTDACIAVWGAARVGMHLATYSERNGMSDRDLPGTFGYIASELGRRKLAFICLREALSAVRVGPHIRKLFGGVFVANEGFTKDSAGETLAAGEADAVAFGVPFIANPDLPERLRVDAPLNAAHPETFYVPGPKGYTDYPALEAVAT